jgi:hypothetical protein
MPPFGADATLALIRELSRRAEVIVLSGWPTLAEALDHGAVGYVRKEFNFSFEKLADAIRGRPAFAAPAGFLTVKELQAELEARKLPCSRPWVAGVLQKMPSGVIANRAPLSDVLAWLEANPDYRCRGDE